MMLFEEALKKAREGSGIYRLEWKNDDTLFYNAITNEIECSNSEVIGIWNWQPNNSDILANDWEEV